jgi:hypothetical protein
MTTKRLRAGVVVVLACALVPTAAAVASGRPSVTKFSFSPSTFAPATRAAAAQATGAATTIRFHVSARATVRIRISRKLKGRRVGRHCVASTPQLRNRRTCTRYNLIGALARGGQGPGDEAIAFSGRFHGRALSPGEYRATITAIDRSHHRSARKRTRFTIIVRRASAGSPGTPAPPPTPPAAPRGWPNPDNTGVPAGWAPAQTRTSDMTVTQPGAVIQDFLFVNANLIVSAPNVTVRRVKFQGGLISNWQGPNCSNGLVVEDSTFEPPPGQQFSNDSEGATGVGGYTARRVKIWRRQEGFRAGGKSGGCGPVTIEDSFAKISIPPGCPGDPHSDGIQGFDGPPLTVTNTTIDFNEADCGTAPFFVPSQQGNTTADVNGLLVMGGGAAFRDGVPGSVRGLKVVDKTWTYFPVTVNCGMLSVWDAQVVTITPDYQIASAVRPLACSGSD